MGAVSGEWLELMDIDQPVWVADLNWDVLLGFIPGKDLKPNPEPVPGGASRPCVGSGPICAVSGYRSVGAKDGEEIAERGQPV